MQGSSDELAQKIANATELGMRARRVHIAETLRRLADKVEAGAATGTVSIERANVGKRYKIVLEG